MELWVLRLIHIPSSVLWGGWTAMVGLFLLPAILESGPAGGAVMGAVMKRRFSLWMNVLGLLSFITGLRLYMLSANAEWIASGSGLSLTVGAVLATVAFGVGHGVSRPTTAKLNAVVTAVRNAGGPPSAEQAAQMQALSARAAAAGKLNAWCTIVAAICMGLSRYFPG